MYLEHIVLTLTLTPRNYGTEYDYNDFLYALYDYYGRSEDSLDFKDFEYLDEVSKENTDRDIYDWLGNSHPKRGDIKVELVSPHGTKSTLLPYRNYDFINAEGYDSWPFMSLHYWGENPIGTWTVNVYFQSNSGYVYVRVNLFEFYGTNVIPEAVSRIPDSCDEACSYKCAAAEPEFCDACKQLRLATTLECVDSCPLHFTEYNGYCVRDEMTTASSNPGMLLTTTSSVATASSSSTSETLVTTMYTTEKLLPTTTYTTSSVATASSSSTSEILVTTTYTTEKLLSTVSSTPIALSSPASNATASSSDNDLVRNMSFLLPIVIGGVILFTIGVAVAVSISIYISRKMKIRKQITNQHQMMPLDRSGEYVVSNLNVIAST